MERQNRQQSGPNASDSKAWISQKPRLSERLSHRPHLNAIAARGDLSQLSSLLEEGVDPNTPSPNGTTALVAAARSGKLEAVQLLLEHGAKQVEQALQAAREALHQQVVEHLEGRNR